MTNNCQLTPTDPNPTDNRPNQAWRDGGYSDDLLLAALCTREGLPVATHRAALLPQLLGGGAAASWRGYWNYLRRQLYVLDTYHDAHCRGWVVGAAAWWGLGCSTDNNTPPVTHLNTLQTPDRLNHTMMAIHSWASWCVAFAMLSAAWQLSCSLVPLAVDHLAAAVEQLQPRAAAVGGWVAAAASSGGVVSQVLTKAGMVGAGLCPETVGSWTDWRSVGLLMFVAVVVMAQLSLAWMSHNSLLMMKALSAEGGKAAAPSPTNGGSGSSAAILQQAAHVSWFKVWLGIFVESLVLPLCVAYTLVNPEIDWAGIRYRKRGGRVRVVGR